MCACADVLNFTYRDLRNVSIETWIRATKFEQKIPIRSGDINKMRAAFPRSGMLKGEFYTF